MQIVLRHIQIRVPDHALDRGQVYAQCLHLRDIGVPAGMGRQLADSFDRAYLLLECIPVVFGVEGLFLAGRLQDVLLVCALQFYQ